MTTIFTVTIDTTAGGDSSLLFTGDFPYQPGFFIVAPDGSSAVMEYRSTPNGGPATGPNYRINYSGSQFAYDPDLGEIEGFLTSADLLRDGAAYASLDVALDANVTAPGAPVGSVFDMTADALLTRMKAYGPAVEMRLYGNIGEDRLTGSGRSDLLDGRAGADVMIGRGGNDNYYVDDTLDLIVEVAGEGTDTVFSSATYTLSANLENLTLIGSAAVNGAGNTLANVLTGNAGANVLAGGAGDDTYLIQTAGDRIVEAANAGVDTVRSTVTYAADANVENVILEGSANINAAGNALANVITGNTGTNTLAGGAGDDTYYIQNAGDRVSEAANGGVDTVRSTVTYAASANIERIILSGDAAIDATGNALANTLVGNARGNTLDGGGGADRMSAGLGNDVYFVDNAGDVVTEDANAGFDTVLSFITFTLGANFEQLELVGTADIDGIGNAADNNLAGNSGDNRLNGGAGADSMFGFAGDDVYYFDNVGDAAFEDIGAGTDTVRSTVSVTLSDDIENLALSGTAAVNGTGNGLANAITGSDAANTLDGRSGLDTLKGGLGADIFRFSTALAPANVDRIVDFSVADDTVHLGSGVFAGIALGALDADAFVTGLAAQDAEDRIIYDRVNGRLLYDEDGTGADAATVFATIQAGLNMTAADFRVVAVV